MKRSRIPVYLTPQLKAALSAQATEEGHSASNIISRAIADYLRRAAKSGRTSA